MSHFAIDFDHVLRWEADGAPVRGFSRCHEKPQPCERCVLTFFTHSFTFDRYRSVYFLNIFHSSLSIWMRWQETVTYVNAWSVWRERNKSNQMRIKKMQVQREKRREMLTIGGEREMKMMSRVQPWIHRKRWICLRLYIQPRVEWSRSEEWKIIIYSNKHFKITSSR